MKITKELDKVVDKYLKLWYSILNRVCFDGKLPKKLPVKSCRSKEFRGSCLIKGRRVLGIVVDPRDPELVQVLLHEMVHAYQTCVLKYPDHFPDHDSAFWQKLRVCRRVLSKLD